MTDEAATGESQTAASVNNGEPQTNVAAQNAEAANSNPLPDSAADVSVTSAQPLTTTNPGGVVEPVVPEGESSTSGLAVASVGVTIPAPADTTVVVGEPKSFFEVFFDHLKKELKEGEELVGQYFQLHFRKHAAGHHTLSVQASGRASDVKEFTVNTEIKNG